MADTPTRDLSPEIEQALLLVLETISEQQKQISDQLAKLLEALTTPPDSSLVEQLSKLLEPLFSDVAEIKQKLASVPATKKG